MPYGSTDLSTTPSTYQVCQTGPDGLALIRQHFGAKYDGSGNVIGVDAGVRIDAGQVVGPVGYTLVYVSGNAQSAAAGAAVTNPLILQVLRQGVIQTSLTVAWECTSDGTTVLSGASSLTDVTGKAQITVTAGSIIGAANIRATVGTDVLDFALTITPATVGSNQLGLYVGDGQSAMIDTRVTTDPAIQLLDPVGNPLAGKTIAWAIVTGSGTLTAATSDTDAAGIATIGWTLGHVAGSNTMTATYAGATGSPLTFTASGTAALATVLSLVSGQAQGPVVSVASADMVVKAATGGGTGVQSVTVVYTVVTGGGTLTGGGTTASIVTGATGVTASIKYTPPATVESYTITAAVQGLTGSPITFTGTSIAGTATKALMLTQPPGNAQTGQALTGSPAVKVTDSGGNTNLAYVGNVVVSIGSGSGTITGGTTTRAAVAGIATFPGLIITGSGNITLDFTPTSLTKATSSAIAMSPPIPDHLLNGTNPANISSGGTITTTCNIVDITGAVCTGTNSAVTATLVAESGSGSISSGTTSPNAASGVASFSLGITSTAGGTFHLAYTSGTLPGTNSASFIVAAAGTSPFTNIPGTGLTILVARTDWAVVPPLTTAVDAYGMNSDSNGHRNNMSIVVDGGINTLNYHFAANFGGGSSPGLAKYGTSTNAFSYSTLEIGLEVKTSAGWTNGSNAGTKLLFIKNTGWQTGCYINHSGTDNSNFAHAFGYHTQGTGTNEQYLDNLYSMNSAHQGIWLRFECRLEMNTAGSHNGRYKFWVDGVLKGDTGLTVMHVGAGQVAKFAYVSIETTFGGVITPPGNPGQAEDMQFRAFQLQGA